MLQNRPTRGVRHFLTCKGKHPASGPFERFAMIKGFGLVAKTTTDKSIKPISEPKAAGAPIKGKKVSPPKKGNAPNALQKPLQPSKELAVIVGSEPLARGEVVSKVWEYIKKNNLQNPTNKREIMADEALKKVFGKSKATMFEMNKFFSQHLT